MRVFSLSIVIGISVIATDRALAQNSSLTNWSQPRFDRSLHEVSKPDGESQSSSEWTGETEFELPEVEDPFDEPIETDRHDFTQSPKVVGRGVRQLEFGFFFSTLTEGTESEKTYATPELLFRYGLNERTEFRTRFNYAWKYNNEEEDIQGSEDLILGIKYQLSEQCCRRPESALELRLSAPTGADDLSTGRWEPGFDYIYGWEFGEYFSLTGSTGANANALGDIAFITVDTDPNDKFIAWSQSIALGAKLTDKTTGYFEWFGIFTHGRDDESRLGFLNFGLDYLITKNVVVDVRIGWGLTEDSDDIFGGIGGAFRF